MHVQDGRTPLYSASWKGHLPVVQVLIANGASIDKAKHVSDIQVADVAIVNLCLSTKTRNRAP